MASPSDIDVLAAAQLAAAGAPAPEDQGEIDGEDLEPIPWTYQTATLDRQYAGLELVGTSRHHTPMASAWYNPDDTLALALPAGVAPWLTSHLVRLGDMGTGAPSEDGQCIAVVFLRTNPSAAHYLGASGVISMWALDQRWPASESRCSVTAEENVPLHANGAPFSYDVTSALPPTEVSMSP